jgi:hypothetical protein
MTCNTGAQHPFASTSPAATLSFISTIQLELRMNSTDSPRYGELS